MNQEVGSLSPSAIYIIIIKSTNCFIIVKTDYILRVIHFVKQSYFALHLCRQGYIIGETFTLSYTIRSLQCVEAIKIGTLHQEVTASE